MNEIDPRLSLLDELIRINIQGNPLRSMKPQMRSAEAIQLKAYLKNKLGNEDMRLVNAANKNLPGASFRMTP